MIINLMNGDCLELMRDIPDGSIDMVLCDLPYGITQNLRDSCVPLEPLWEQYLRIIKPNGVIALTSQCEVVHSTQKPIALMEYLIMTCTNEGDTVLDNCMGSGTIGVACVNLNRNFIGMEISKEYFDIASERIKQAYNGSVQLTI